MASALREAAGNNDVAAVNAILATGVVDIDSAALAWAARNNAMEAAKVLLQANSNPNVRIGAHVSILNLVARHGMDTMIQLLIDNKADVNVPDICGYTALHMATRCGHILCVDILLRAGANPNIRNDWGDYPLYAAICDNSRMIAKLLIQASALLPENIRIPKWAKDIVDQKHNAKRALITFLGVMKYRFRLECQATQIIGYRYPRDMTRKISGEIWDTRFNDKWHPRVMKRVKVCDHKCKNKEMCGHLCCKK